MDGAEGSRGRHLTFVRYVLVYVIQRSIFKSSVSLTRPPKKSTGVHYEGVVRPGQKKKKGRQSQINVLVSCFHRVTRKIEKRFMKCFKSLPRSY